MHLQNGAPEKHTRTNHGTTLTDTDTDTDTDIFEPDPHIGVAFHKLTSYDGEYHGEGEYIEHTSTHSQITVRMLNIDTHNLSILFRHCSQHLHSVSSER